MVVSILTKCRACQSDSLYLFLPMNDHPPANMFVRAEEVEKEQPAFPLNTQVCLDCGLIQVADQIPPGFFDHYLYVPSGATAMHDHFADLAEVVTGTADGSLVADIGCNDGLMLMQANKLGARTLGIDPAANIAEIAAERGVDVEVCYFTPATAETIAERHGKAGVIVTTNTFHHIGDLHAFMDAVTKFLDDDGTFIVEVPWALQIVKLNQFDNVYHEHVSELTVKSFTRLAAFFGMRVVDVQKLAIHGGSLRVFMEFDSKGTTPSADVDAMIQEEHKAGLFERATYEKFANNVLKLREELIEMIDDMKVRGLKIAGYGAPAKGNTLLNFFDIGTERIDFLVDRNTLKHGLFSPGKKIPILPTDAIAREKPDVLLVLAWNFFDEIREQQAEFEKAGGRYIIPLPKPAIVGNGIAETAA
jgi:SAM-dependent methyltransferase